MEAGGGISSRSHVPPQPATEGSVRATHSNSKTVNHANFRFYAELNDFLPPARRSVSSIHKFEFPSSAKDMIESLGVPHTEIGLIAVNGMLGNFGHIVQNGDCVAVYPTFRSISIPREFQLRPPLPEARFVADVHLGRLASYLRMLGFDTVYRSGADDGELAHTSSTENRILLTRDRGLLKRGEVVYGYFVRETQVRMQLLEIVRRFDLAKGSKPFSRCLRCNATLEAIEKDAIKDRLLAATRRHFEKFTQCRSCRRVYWGGSHYLRMLQIVEEVTGSNRSNPQDPQGTKADE